jgi:hypothetical protein
MKYTQQTQNSLNRLDESLRILRDLIKRGENAQAIQYMESGDLKERFGDLQNMITLSSTNSLGASGVSNIGNL